MDNSKAIDFIFLFLSTYTLSALLGIVGILACLRYIFRKNIAQSRWERIFSFRNLIIGGIGARIINAGLLMYIQYSVWSEGGLGNYFLTAPLPKDLPIVGIKSYGVLFTSKFGYFLFYSWGRFWLSVIISVFVAYVFYVFLKMLSKKTERFFDEGEQELGFVCALVVGWPLFVVFLPLVFFSVVMVSIVRLIIFKEPYTTLGIPFILAMIILFLFGGYAMDLLRLAVLKV